MKRSTLASSVAACFCLGLAGQAQAAEAPQTGTTHHSSLRDEPVAATKSAAKCLSDLRAFDGQMGKDGYWLGGSGDGYGYPMAGIGYGYGYPMGGYPAATGYLHARPGYEVRMLIAAANILARHGKQQECEAVLATTRTVYKEYQADLRKGGVPMANVPGWRNQQIAAAQSVTSKTNSFRSDELLGADVRNAKNESLGSVDDLVLSPKTGMIAYLVIARGGIFGIGEKYVPVPWADFKIAPNVDLLVLEATKSAMDAAPRVTNDHFTAPGNFEQESQKVDAFWKVHLSTEGNIPPKG